MLRIGSCDWPSGRIAATKLLLQRRSNRYSDICSASPSGAKVELQPSMTILMDFETEESKLLLLTHEADFPQLSVFVASSSIASRD